MKKRLLSILIAACMVIFAGQCAAYAIGEIPEERAIDREDLLEKYRKLAARHYDQFRIILPLEVKATDITDFFPESIMFNDQDPDSWSDSECFTPPEYYANAFSYNEYGTSYEDDRVVMNIQNVILYHQNSFHNAFPLYIIITFPRMIPDGIEMEIDGNPAQFNDERTAAKALWNEQCEPYDPIQKEINISFIGLLPTEILSWQTNDILQWLYTSNDLFVHTGIPDQGDYLYSHTQSRSVYCAEPVLIGATENSLLYDLPFEFFMSFYSTAEMEDEVSYSIDDVLDELALDGKSDYEKIKAIHDFICVNTIYEQDQDDDTPPLIKHSAYSALINQKAVCDGYASLFYRMCLRAGLDARIITGKDDQGQNHAWNIVKIGEKWYDVDTLRDDIENGPGTTYFLTPHPQFLEDHTPDSKYTDRFFVNDHPMSEAGYLPVEAVSLDKTEAQTVTVGDKVSLTASISPENAGDKTVRWGVSDGAVALYSDADCTIPVGPDDTSTLTVYAMGVSAGKATVTATSNGDSTRSASCDVTVYEVPELTWDDIRGYNTDMNDVTQPLNLPTTLPHGASVRWDSNSPTTISPTTGEVNRVGDDIEVILTAEISLSSGLRVTKTFCVTVPGLPSLVQNIFEQASAALGWGDICGENKTQDKVWADLSLPEKLGPFLVDEENGPMIVYVTWSSSNETVVSTTNEAVDGVINGAVNWTAFGSTTDVLLHCTMRYTHTRTVHVGDPDYIVSENPEGDQTITEEYTQKIYYPLTVYARADGNVGEGCGLTWSLNDIEKILRVSGTGSMDFDVVDGNQLSIPWQTPPCNCISNIQQAEIGEGVTSVGERAFDGAENLTTVYLPSTLESIDSNAFNGCSNLAAVVYADSADKWAQVTKGDGNDSITGLTYHQITLTPGPFFTGTAKYTTVSHDTEYTLPSWNDTGFGWKDGIPFKAWLVRVGSAEPVITEREETLSITADTTVMPLREMHLDPVTLSASIWESEPASLGQITVSPAGTLYAGETVTLTAPDLPGHIFQGWYSAVDDGEGNLAPGETPLCQDLTYTFPITADTAVFAKYLSKEEQTAPTGLAATIASSSTAADGTISGVDDTMEYQKEGDTEWTAVGSGQTEISGLTSGTYSVRYAETADKKASPAATVEVGVNKTVATVSKAPEAKTLYAGSAQELVTAGEAIGGEMQYALGTETEAAEPFTTSIPMGTDAGTYYVWYKVEGDEDHLDLEPMGPLEVRIVPSFDTPDFILSPSVTSVEEEAFEGIVAAVVEIPESCSAIGDHAFRNCSKLTKIRIPGNCALGVDVFEGCELVYVFGEANSPAEAYCNDPAHGNCVFVEESLN